MTYSGLNPLGLNLTGPNIVLFEPDKYNKCTTGCPILNEKSNIALRGRNMEVNGQLQFFLGPKMSDFYVSGGYLDHTPNFWSLQGVKHGGHF